MEPLTPAAGKTLFDLDSLKLVKNLTSFSLKLVELVTGNELAYCCHTDCMVFDEFFFDEFESYGFNQLFGILASSVYSLKTMLCGR